MQRTPGAGPRNRELVVPWRTSSRPLLHTWQLRRGVGLPPLRRMAGPCNAEVGQLACAGLGSRGCFTPHAGWQVGPCSQAGQLSLQDGADARLGQGLFVYSRC